MFDKMIAKIRYSLKVFSKDSNERLRVPLSHSFVVCIIVLDLILVSFVTKISLDIKDKSKPKVETMKDFTVNCEDLALSLEEDSVTFDIKNGLYKQDVIGMKYTCSTTNLTDLVYKFVQRKLRVNLAKGNDTRTRNLSCGNRALAPTSGYLSVALSRISNKTIQDAQKDGIVFWDVKDRSSYIWPTFSIKHGGVTISETKNYFVFVTVMFEVGNEIGKEANYLTTTGDVYVFVSVEQYGHENTILHTSEQISLRNNQSSTTSLHIGSQVLLEEGDTLRVRVSDPRRLVINSRGNAFGLMPFD